MDMDMDLDMVWTWTWTWTSTSTCICVLYLDRDDEYDVEDVVSIVKTKVCLIILRSKCSSNLSCNVPVLQLYRLHADLQLVPL